MKRILVCGAGGFIGSHLVERLKSQGHYIVGADLKTPEFSETVADSFLICDLRDMYFVKHLLANYKIEEVYQLAADMGGAGYIFTGEHDAEIMHNSAQINLNVAEACKQAGIKKIFYSSSACMYPQEIQRISNNTGLQESDAYPANPDSEYGWEKLFSERLYLSYARNHGIDVRIARFHNIYGVRGTYKGGREKAPAAMCRKVIECIPDYVSGGVVGKDGEMSIDVWGDGLQTRSFLYIDACIDGILRLMGSDCKHPVNIGSDEMVSINQLAQIAIDISGKPIKINNVESKALGVRGRNSDNEFIYSQLGWKPEYDLRKGMDKTYAWIKSQYE